MVPRWERALATGLFNSGSNIGAIVAPLAVPWVAVHLGWRFAFLFTGIFSALWLAAGLSIYRPAHTHPKVSGAELALIRSDAAEPAANIPWISLLPHRQTWAYVIAKSLTDPIWWFSFSGCRSF